MKIIAKPLLVSLAFLPAFCYAAIFEKPVHTNFKGSLPEENVVSGYVQFGTLPNGANAIQAASRTKARFYSRDAMSTVEIYFVYELDCKSGILQLAGLGNLERSKAISDPPAAANISELNPKDVPTYREICAAVEIDTSW